MKSPDLNCDLGETEAITTTAALMECIDSANIACGGHAGHRESIERCIDLAQKHHVQIGAHPGLAEAGGRGNRFPTVEELIQLLEDQVLSFHEIVNAQGTTMHHVKLHGTLYHATDQNAELAHAYTNWVQEHFPSCRLFVRSGGLTAQIAKDKNLHFWNECFLDRGYESDGLLVPRNNPHALITDPANLRQRLEIWRDHHYLLANNGEILPLSCETFCLHSDSAHAVAFAKIAKNFFVNSIEL